MSSGACLVADCGKPVVARGVCAQHYYKLRRYGDPLAGRTYGRSVSYDGAHARVKAARGKAVDRVCGCGSPAVDWAYDNLDPEEQVSDKGYAYSSDPEHYIAMCRKCHRKHDIQHRIAAAAAYRQIRFGGIACVS